MRDDRSIESGGVPLDDAAAREALEGMIRRTEELAREMRAFLLATPWIRGAAPPRPAPAELPAVHLEIEGARIGRRSGVRLNGADVELQDNVFVFLLRLVCVHERELRAWSTKSALGIANSPWMTSRVRAAFRGSAPAGLKLVEADGRERFRLNPLVVVTRVDLAALATHPDAVVRRLAAEWPVAKEVASIPVLDREGPHGNGEDPDRRSGSSPVGSG
jgi:hypothetical protein